MALTLLASLTSCQKPPTALEEKALLDTGRAASQATMERLGGQLKAALQAGGPVVALRVCQSMAGPLTEAAGGQFPGAAIRRTSLQPRNLANAPDAIDRKVLKMLAAAQPRPEEHTVWTSHEGRYYKPLVIQDVCLKCHGDPATFSPELKAALQELYPADQATGYVLGEFRGVVRVDLARSCSP